MKKYCLLLLLVMLLFTAGCGINESQSIVLESDSIRKSVSRNDQLSGGIEASPTYNEEKGDKAAENDTKIERKIIRNANVSLEVENPVESLSEIELKIKTLNGWLVESSSSGYENNSSAEIQVRIPEEELDEFLVWIDSIGKISYKRLYADEITLEYYDYQARLENARNQKQQYLEIMGKANNVKDVLEVQNHIDMVQERIDSYARRIEVWNIQVANSLVAIDLYQSSRAVVTSKDPEWNPLTLKEMNKRLRNGLVSFFNGLTVFLQGALILFLTVFIWIFLLLWLIWIIIKKVKKNKKRKK
ncbi:MAG: DUF4349 domain-containing protein [Caldisericia bacterium]|nr:DUF4349 domain-containing protein [Caldisericia bacterium]